MIIKGFKFGMLLQLAIGPICLYIFKLAIETTILNAFIGILGVVIIDGLFIALSIIGVSSMVNKNEQILKLVGSIILIVFGFMTIYGAVFNEVSTSDILVANTYMASFVKAIVLTGANPLTIIFWSGVFSGKIIEEGFDRNDEIQFGIGALSSTFISLSVVAILGQFTSTFINSQVIMLLNIIVGLLLIYFGLKLALKRVVIS